MGFWSTLGKVGLKIAPYVAAPFTGGASLAFVPAANAAVSAWDQHDASNAAKGLAPSPSVVNNSVGRTNPTGTTTGQAVPRGQSSNGVMPRGGFGFADNPMNQTNQNSPNLAQSIFQGRQQAMKDQPFRAGYEVNWPGQISPGSPANTPTPMTTSYMPRISSDVRYGPGLFSYKNPPRRGGFGRPRQQTTDGAVGG